MPLLEIMLGLGRDLVTDGRKLRIITPWPKGQWEIILPEGQIIPQKGCIIPHEGCNRARKMKRNIYTIIVIL